MGIDLRSSDTICRLCGCDKGNTTPIFSPNGPSRLADEISFFLPIQPTRKGEGLFPDGICDCCRSDFDVVSAFFVNLNEGQARLSNLLAQLENVHLKMPNWLEEKRTLFPFKYPYALPRKSTPSSKDSIDVNIVPVPQTLTYHRGPGKRKMRLPQRLVESVQGVDLESLFLKDGKEMLNEPSDDGVYVQTSKYGTNSVEYSSCENQHPEIAPADVEPGDLLEDDTEVKKTSEIMACDICSKVFKQPSKLEHHRRVAHVDGGTYFVCTSTGCAKMYKTRSAIRLHQTSVGHSGHLATFHGATLSPSDTRESYECDKCDKVFAHPSSLHYHKESQHRSLSLRCRQCGKTFKTKQLLSRHSASVHSDNRPYNCNLCQMKFKSSTNLKTHQISHSEEKIYSCELCGKQFSYKASLIQHIKWHEGNKPYKCPHCDKSFSQKGNLREHIRIHTGDKPFHCNQCERKFTTSSQRRLHQKRHKGEKPWKCDFCPKAFLHKDTWTAHVRRHKGERPFSCEICPKTFADVWALKKHQRLHTGERPYVCHICQKSFSDGSNLSKHRKIHALPSSEELCDTTRGSDVVSVSAADMLPGKTQVWNIIQSVAATDQQDHTLSGIVQEIVTPTKTDIVEIEEDNVEQIIYVTYEENEDQQDGVAHMMSDVSVLPSDGNTCSNGGVIVQQESEDDTLDLNQLSDVATLQLAEAVGSVPDSHLLQAQPHSSSAHIPIHISTPAITTTEVVNIAQFQAPVVQQELRCMDDVSTVSLSAAEDAAVSFVNSETPTDLQSGPVTR